MIHAELSQYSNSRKNTLPLDDEHSQTQKGRNPDDFNYWQMTRKMFGGRPELGRTQQNRRTDSKKAISKELRRMKGVKTLL